MRKSIDLWRRLSGSPELRPKTPSVTSSLALDRVDDDVEMDVDTDGAAVAPTMTESVVHLHELPDDFCYAYFERGAGVADIQTPCGVVVVNDKPCTPRVVRADAISWRPVLSRDALSGHRFDFMLGGELQAHIEAFVDASSVCRVAFVHGAFSQLARASGLIDLGSLIEYNSPAAHLQKLRDFLVAISPTQLYLPQNEVAIGPAMDADFGLEVKIDPRHSNNPTAAVAPLVWRRVCEETNAIWRVARAASEQHNDSELARCGLRT